MHEGMLMIMNKTVESFLSTVGAVLRCSERMKQYVLCSLRRDIVVYADRGGELSTEALRARFGAPEAYAAECVEQLETEELTRRIRTGRFVKRAVLVTAVCAAVILAVLVSGVVLYNNREPQPWPAGVPFPTV